MSKRPYQQRTKPWPKSAASMRAEVQDLIDTGAIHPSNGQEKPAKFQHRFENAAYGGLSALMKVLPTAIGLRLVKGVARSIGWMARSRNREVLSRMGQAFPEKSDQQLKQIIAAMWANMGQTFYELLIYPSLQDHIYDRATFHGLAGVEDIQARGQPIMFIVAHQANWELIPRLLESSFGNLTYIYARQSNPIQDQWALFRRTADGARAYPRNLPTAAECMAKDMLEGYPMLIALDHALRGPTIPFFGMPAHTGTGPLRIAQATGAAVIPIQIRRKPGLGALAISFLPPLDMGTKEAPRDRTAVMTDYNKLLEESISGAPEEWFWLHRRWKAIKKPAPKA